MNHALQELMRTATRLTRAGRLSEATATIRRALGQTAEVRPAATGLVLDGCVFEAPDPTRATRPASAPPPAMRERARDDRPVAGEFSDGVHTHGSLTRRYKLYVPAGHAGRALPLVVMLHGCTQDPDDFAAGTGMNALADEFGLCVLYPAQAQDANPSRCWNWFKHNHQARERGETALIGTLTRAVIEARGIDAERVYVAGLSAGGAMAALVAAAHPDLFAAVGVHSGLPPGAARSLPEALAAMRNGAGAQPLPAGLEAGLQSLAPPRPAADLPVPTIVFHGDRDPTVHPGNGERVVDAVLRGHPRASASAGGPAVERGMSATGRGYTRSTWRDDSGEVVAEHWLVHGAGHAWSGGQPAGSYTDVQGPDASREMLRFFFSRTGRRVALND